MKEPDQLAQEHSKQVCAKITELMQTQYGSISFADFMQQALYAPGLGYYNSGTTKFGAGGDFITAPELGNLFAKCVAQQAGQILTQLRATTILEIGAGSGQLACDLLIALKKLHTHLDKYLILELSADLKAQQQQKIAQQCPEFFAKVEWLDRLPATAINGLIIANEVLDAMPVTRFNFTQQQLQEYYVTKTANSFAYTLKPASAALEKAFSAANLSLYLEAISEPYISEINLWLPAWLKSLSSCFSTGAILLFDYGFPRAEYYHPQRVSGTLMCHYQHHSHADPFWYPGLQDITAHVDFTAVAEAADACGLKVSGYTNLASFLINCGIADYVENSVTQARELNMLSSPAEMGELFKAMILTKMDGDALLGFAQFDKLHSL